MTDVQDELFFREEQSLRCETVTQVITHYYTDVVQPANDLPIFFCYAPSHSEEFFGTKTLEPALSIPGMANLKKKEELIKLPLIKDNKVEDWLNSDTVLDRIINRISDEIFISSKKFGAKVESIELKEAYEDHPFEEIEIDIKVPKEMDINELNDFWDYVGTHIGNLIDNETFTNPEEEKEIREKLLVVVSQ